MIMISGFCWRLAQFIANSFSVRVLKCTTRRFIFPAFIVGYLAVWAEITPNFITQAHRVSFVTLIFWCEAAPRNAF